MLPAVGSGSDLKSQGGGEKGECNDSHILFTLGDGMRYPTKKSEKQIKTSLKYKKELLLTFHFPEISGFFFAELFSLSWRESIIWEKRKKLLLPKLQDEKRRRPRKTASEALKATRFHFFSLYIFEEREKNCFHSTQKKVLCGRNFPSLVGRQKSGELHFRLDSLLKLAYDFFLPQQPFQRPLDFFWPLFRKALSIISTCTFSSRDNLVGRVN